MEYNDQIIKRLKRVEGQVGGVIRMMNEEKNCKDVISQLSAVRSAVDKTIAVIVATNLEKCLTEEMASGNDTRKMVEEAVNLLVKSR
ncbi:metal-sensitive transcriptional regulator [Bacillus changyiensis]|uniref:metal-sensitive transcriptional regulator n=1 Tax=Bacillus changyiensis TaxID=3004103 RepID=UPI0022E86D75|nr:metal-sensitive transcriptional regulator [Bacillus changyiensis]MDA1475156.1 metal-sensitive transcriptional regulator [Bacillus changyiensis]